MRTLKLIQKTVQNCSCKGVVNQNVIIAKGSFGYYC